MLIYDFLLSRPRGIQYHHATLLLITCVEWNDVMAMGHGSRVTGHERWPISISGIRRCKVVDVWYECCLSCLATAATATTTTGDATGGGDAVACVCLSVTQSDEKATSLPSRRRGRAVRRARREPSLDHRATAAPARDGPIWLPSRYVLATLRPGRAISHAATDRPTFSSQFGSQQYLWQNVTF